mgnify:FL=1
MNAIERKTFKALFWFGGRVREKTRSYIGKPNIEGEVKVRSGKESATKRRKPRAAGRPPISRVPDSLAKSLRNIQYRARQSSSGGKAFGEVEIFSLKFGGGAGKSAPDLQEKGGKALVRAKKVTIRTRTGRARKRGGQVQKRLIFGKRFPAIAFRIPARPFMAPVFKKAIAEFKKRLAQGRFK